MPVTTSAFQHNDGIRTLVPRAEQYQLLAQFHRDNHRRAETASARHPIAEQPLADSETDRVYARAPAPQKRAPDERPTVDSPPLHDDRQPGHDESGNPPAAACCGGTCVCRKPRPFDLGKESRNVGQDGRAAPLPFEAVGFAVQVDQPA
jgi:hypothetical protein